MKVKSLSKCPTLRDPMDRSLPGSFAHGILQARVLEWVAIAVSIYGNIFHVVFTIIIYLFKVFKLSLQLVALDKH